MWRCVPRLMQFSNYSYLLSVIFSHLASRLYFPNLSRAPLNDRSSPTYRLSPVAAHLFLIIWAAIINQSINRFWVTDLNLVQIDCGSVPDPVRSSGWFLYFSNTITLKKTSTFIDCNFWFFFRKKIKWGFYFYLVEWRRGADPRSNLAKRFGARFSSSPTRDALDGTQPRASESSGFSSASPGWPQPPTHRAPHAWCCAGALACRACRPWPVGLGVSSQLVLPNPRGSPRESGESWNPQPKRAFPPSPVQLIPGTFSPRARDGSGVGSERRSEHIPLRIPASPPRLQGFFFLSFI